MENNIPKKIRIEILKETISYLKYTNFFVCHIIANKCSIRGIIIDYTDVMEAFPELWKERPKGLKDKTVSWYALNRSCSDKRIRAIRRAIKTLEKK